MKGHSLLEMMIVLAIVLIVLMVVVPSQKQFFEHAQDTNLSAQLLRAIALARSEAIIQNDIMTLCNSADGKTCGGGWEQGYIIFSSQKIIHVFQNPTNQGHLNWRAFPNNEQALSFLPSGRPANQNGTFWYCSPNVPSPRWAIAISQSGRARLMQGLEITKNLTCPKYNAAQKLLSEL